MVGTAPADSVQLAQKTREDDEYVKRRLARVLNQKRRPHSGVIDDDSVADSDEVVMRDDPDNQPTEAGADLEREQPMSRGLLDEFKKFSAAAQRQGLLVVELNLVDTLFENLTERSQRSFEAYTSKMQPESGLCEHGDLTPGNTSALTSREETDSHYFEGERSELKKKRAASLIFSRTVRL